MKVAILTFHRAYNNGAVLQCYALTEKLKSMGAEVVVVDYWPKYFKKVYYMLPEMPKGVHTMKNAMRRIYHHYKCRGILRARNKNFESFLSDFLPLSEKTYLKPDEVDESDLSYDIYLTGSDQVWNDKVAKFDRIFFLDFKEAKNKYSYSASFGMDKIPDNLREEYLKRLSDYKAYSVREESGVEIIRELFGKQAALCCDPTLLLDASSWERLLANKNAAYLSNQNYILVYYVVTADSLRENAVKIAEEKNCKVISMPCYVSYPYLLAEADKNAGFEVCNTGGPLDFLTLFYNASYVMTNSFHGTVFSLLFHKKFKSQICMDTGKRNGRSESLLKMVGLSDRCMENNSVDIDTDIDWEKVDSKISEYRESSTDYLRDMINRQAYE